VRSYKDIHWSNKGEVKFYLNQLYRIEIVLRLILKIQFYLKGVENKTGIVQNSDLFCQHVRKGFAKGFQAAVHIFRAVGQG
jgi:hypothetical protein